MSDDAENIEYFYPTPHEDIAAAYNAFYMMDAIDTKLVSKETERKIKAIQRMSINIVYAQIKYMNDLLSEEENPDE